MHQIELQIDGLNQSYADGMEASQTVTSTLGFKERFYVYRSGGDPDSGHYMDLETGGERASSILLRAQAFSRAKEAESNLPIAWGEYAKLSKQRPPDELVEGYTELIDYERELQCWELHLARDVRITGGMKPIEVRATYETSPVYARVRGDVAHEIEAVDEWRTESDVRGDSRLLDESRPLMSIAAMEQWKRERLDAYDAEVAARGLDAAATRAEHNWARYLFAPPFGDKAGDPDGVDAQRALMDCAFDQSGSPESIYADAVSLLNYSKFEEAAKRFERCAYAYARVGDFWINYARTLLRLARFDDAVKAYTSACEVAPRSPAAHVELALCCALQNRWSEASKLYDAWLPHLPEDEIEWERALADSFSITHRDRPVAKAIERLKHPSLLESEVFREIRR